MMKKILFLCVCLVVTTTTYSQSPFGIKAGFNGGYLRESLAEGVDHKINPDFYIGVFTSIPIGAGVMLQPEIVYSRQGGRYSATISEENSSDIIDQKAIVRLGYLNIPLLIKYEVAKGVFVNMGPQLGINLNGRSEMSSEYRHGDDGYSPISYEEGDIAALTSCDFSLVVGFEYMLTSQLNISARYNLGLTNITKVENASLNNRVFQIGVGYRLFK